MKSGFITELKRRNVHRAAAIYAGTAWLMVQIATQVFPFFEVANGVVRWVVLVVVALFPFAMLFSWFYEWTPQGIQRESEVERADSVTRQTGKTMDRWIIAVLGTALVLLILDQFVLRKVPWASGHEVASIAVLPMANSTGDPANEYFSDGVSEELINSLARLHGVKVVGRISSFQFKGKEADAQAIADKLGVTYLLEGSVRKSAAEVRIAVSLIKAADGTALWAQSFDRDFKDIFAIETEISSTVATQLKVALLGDNADTLKTPSAATPSNANSAAYVALLQGSFYRYRNNKDDHRKSINYYEEAIRLDPGYALAYAQLSFTEVGMVARFLTDKDRAEMDRLSAGARSMAERALALAPGLADAHEARGVVLEILDQNLAGARAEFAKATALAPKNPAGLAGLARLQGAVGQLEAAVITNQRAVELDPLWITPRFNLAGLLTALGRYDEAEVAFGKALEMQPQAASLRGQLSWIQTLRGDTASAVVLALQETDPFYQTVALATAYGAARQQPEADAELKKLIDEDADAGGSQIAQVYAARAQPDQVFDWLERARVSGDSGILEMRENPFLLRYKNDPRYLAFGRKIGVIGPDEVP